MVLICHTPSSRQEEWQAPKDTSYFGADSSRGSAVSAWELQRRYAARWGRIWKGRRWQRHKGWMQCDLAGSGVEMELQAGRGGGGDIC